MSEVDLEYLLGGFATNTLTEAEHQALFRAAMVNQRLFDLLADEQALKELLDDPAVRRRLVQQLKQTQGQTRPDWYERTIAWITRWDTLAVVGSVAVVALATFFGVQLYEESQRLLQEDHAKPGLSEVLKEPTVRAKLGTKPPGKEQEPAPPGAGPAIRHDERDGTPRPTAPSTRRPGTAAGTTGASDTARDAAKPDRAGDSVADARPSPKSAATSSDSSRPESSLAATDAGPRPLPPVVLPRVPAQMQQRKTPAPSAPSVPLPTPTEDSSADSTHPAVKEPAREERLARAGEAEGAGAERSSVHDHLTEAPPPAPEPPPTGAARVAGTLPPPAVGNARALFQESTTPKPAASPSRSSEAPAMARESTESQLRAPLPDSPQQNGGTVPDSDVRDTSPEETPDTPATPPLAIRYHQRALPLQGTASRTEGLALRELMLQVNQPGYVYVIASDANGAWTVLAPARTGPTAGPAAPGHNYRILMTGASGGSRHPTYLVLSRQPDPTMERAMTLMAEPGKPATASKELEALLIPWLQAFPGQALKTEQASEPLTGGKQGSVTYVADGSLPPKDTILYQVPAHP